MGQVILNKARARTFATRHPWVLDTAIDRVDGAPADGSVVDLVTHRGKFIGRGLYNSRSRIRVRLYTFDRNEPLDEAFWRRRLDAAIALRTQLGYDDPQGAARLVFSEADGLSGLIVDRYAEFLAIQPTALGIAERLPMLTAILVELAHPRGMVLRTEKGMNRAEGMDLRDGPCWGEAPAGPVVIRENGMSFQVDLLEGQKTGFYLDQRENRQAVARYLRGRRVLDLFCYTGGFSLAAAVLGGASAVLGFDSSQKAIELAQANAQLNGATNVRFQTGEAFEVLQRMIAGQERFGAVLLDPPKFARTRQSRLKALRAYHWLNRLALALLEPGGILVTCSCSGLVSREDFLDVLVGAAQQARRAVQVLEQRGAAPDHPVAVNCPETEYLKCWICRVA